MQFQDRWYQEKAVELAMKDLDEKFNPIIVSPTGSGKTAIICKLIDQYLTQSPHGKILILSHVDSILEQNYEKLVEHYSEFFVGLYSAGLGYREFKKVTVAGIQSVYNKDTFDNGGVELIIIDECHMINMTDTGMYRKFLKKMSCQYLGLTATPFRTGQGYLYKQYPGKTPPIFNKVSYDLSSYENYNKLVDEGYLVNLISAPTNYKMDTDDLAIVAGDYKNDDLSNKFDKDEITEMIIDNVIKYGKKKYKKWLLFAIDINHCENIARILKAKGIAADTLHSKKEESKRDVLKKFRNGEIRALVNVNMATTGVDIPDIDLIAMLRATASPIYHVQTAGRGARVSKDKTHCLFLDYAGNCLRHGPINDIRIIEPGQKRKGRPPPAVKICKNCQSENSLRAVFCVACGFEFPTSTKLSSTPSSAPIVKRGADGNPDKDPNGDLTQWCNVRGVSYSIHNKPGRPSSLRVMYDVGMNTYSEWVLIDYQGYHGARARKWVRNRWLLDMKTVPVDLVDLYKNVRFLKKPEKILIKLGEKWPEILDYKFQEEKTTLVGKDIIDTLPEKLHNSLDQMRKNLFSKFNVDKVENSYFDDDIPF